jgi:hypothetical protein
VEDIDIPSSCGSWVGGWVGSIDSRAFRLSGKENNQPTNQQTNKQTNKPKDSRSKKQQSKILVIYPDLWLLMQMQLIRHGVADKWVPAFTNVHTYNTTIS